MYHAGLLLGSQVKKPSPDKARQLGMNLNIADKWARIYLARMCSFLVYAEWTSTQSFVEGVGAPYWNMLTMLATRYVL